MADGDTNVVQKCGDTAQFDSINSRFPGHRRARSDGYTPHAHWTQLGPR